MAGKGPTKASPFEYINEGKPSKHVTQGVKTQEMLGKTLVHFLLQQIQKGTKKVSLFMIERLSTFLPHIIYSNGLFLWSKRV